MQFDTTFSLVKWEKKLCIPVWDKTFLATSEKRTLIDSWRDGIFRDMFDGYSLILSSPYVSRICDYLKWVKLSLFCSLTLWGLCPLSVSVSTVKFEDCQRSREVGFVSSDPNFSVRPDGTVYAEQEVANLSEPVQFMVTAYGLHDPHIWETTVKLALAGHPHPLPFTKVRRAPF